MRVLVTGFGPFGDVGDNPSAWLAERVGFECRVLEVSFAAVDEFVEEVSNNPPDALVLMGVAAGAERMRIETTARNEVGAVPDVRGEVAGPAPIDPLGPPQIGATLWRSPEFFQDNEYWETSTSAGTYLCNYVFYRCLKALPNTAVGFLHVPLADQMPLEQQLEVTRGILDEVSAALESASVPG